MTSTSGVTLVLLLVRKKTGHGRRVEEAYYSAIEPIGHPVKSWDEFVENVRFHFPEREYYKYKQQGFATPSGKVELYSTTLKELGYPPLPEYVGPTENEVDHPELAEKYPLGTDDRWWVHAFSPLGTITRSRICVLSNILRFLTSIPVPLKRWVLKRGDWLWVETARGRMKQRANLTEAIHPKVIYTQRCWWYPEKDMRDIPLGGELGGALESNGNMLTSTADEHCDPYSGSWANRGLLCRVYKVDSKEVN